MRIGFVTEALPYLPSRGGFRLYGANLIRCLARRHRIDLVSFLQDGDDGHLDWAQQHCASMTVIPTRKQTLARRLANFASAVAWGRPLHNRGWLAGRLEKGVQSDGWDVIHVEGGYTGGLVDGTLQIGKVLSVHDSWTLRCEEMLQCSQSLRETLYYKLLKYHEPRYERLVYPRFERCVVVAQRDVEAVQRTAPEARVALIPYGTDTAYFRPLAVEKEPASMVFHSHLGYAPNIEAALELANVIFPLIRREIGGATLRLVGADPVRKIQQLAHQPGITIAANLPDLRAAVCSAAVYVCAIRHGTGLKSKVLEAMGMGMPIVCYPGSTVGIECVPGRHLLVARDPVEFAAHVMNLLRHPERAQEIAEAGRALVLEKYSWESRARAFEELYGQVIEERQARGGRSGRSATTARQPGGHREATAAR